MDQIYDSTTLAAGDLALEGDDVVFLLPAPLLAVLGAISPTAAKVRAGFNACQSIFFNGRHKKQ